MCFSASASFGAGVVLSAISVVSIRKAQSSSQLIFASIPMLFAVQQISEGFLWLALANPAFAFLETITTYVFLFFAQVVWPTWVPVAIFKLEKSRNRQNILKVIVVVGTLVSTYLAYCLLLYPVSAHIIGSHIFYQQDYPLTLRYYGGAFYVVATVAPHFFSSVRRMWFLAIAVFISYIITTLLYDEYFVSVWCFFASIISIVIAVIMNKVNIPPSVQSGREIHLTKSGSHGRF